MKVYLPLSMAAVVLSLAVAPLFAADEQTGDTASGTMKIEQVIAMCEEQNSEDKYPDIDERNKMIDQCIDENSSSTPQQD